MVPMTLSSFIGTRPPEPAGVELMFIHALSENTAMIGDRMDTDVIAGLEAGLETVLVLTGVTIAEEAERFPFRASKVVDSVADLTPLLG